MLTPPPGSVHAECWSARSSAAGGGLSGLKTQSTFNLIEGDVVEVFLKEIRDLSQNPSGRGFLELEEQSQTQTPIPTEITTEETEKYRGRGVRGGANLQRRKKRPTKPVNMKDREKQAGIFNLTPYVLNSPQIKLLQKGLKFAPTKKLNKFETYVDLNKFKRTLCLKKFFYKNPFLTNSEDTQHDVYKHTNLKEKSKFYPSSIR
ncbi:Hypothetical predicted protein [Pelobates cultripes]|uniref:Uncharacterized protein n=1 Tax=Pelobates cultripes TaxID=61616 RepID=A0AAD1WEY0_PELCU|nr:Hypothetical predicted protein [Pelobates cultripes]